MRRFRISPYGSIILAAMTIAPAGGLSGASFAQGPSSSEKALVCMVRKGSDGKPLAIILPALAEKAMRDKGFVPEDCVANFDTPASREDYRNLVCHMAANYRADQILVFERRYGERPGVLCGMAEVAVGQWQLRD
jgi:hypothetical protein